MTQPSIAIAAANNVLQSEAVLAALGSPGTFSELFWVNDHTFDVPYANGATLYRPDAVDDHSRAIDQLLASRSETAPTFVMDSFATLDLAPLGFQVRIADEWFVCDASREMVSKPNDGPPVVRIDTPSGLAEFEAASAIAFGGTPPATPGSTYPASLLRDQRFRFYGVRVDGELVSGVFLFVEPACTGVYTFFTLPDHQGRGFGSQVLQSALATAQGRLLATNPSTMSRAIFERLGFIAIGERRIWARNF